MLENWKKLWNMNVFGALDTVIKGLIQGLGDLEIRGRVETIQTTALLVRPEYWEESRRLEETCCHLNSSRRPSANTGMENSQRGKIIEITGTKGMQE